MAGSIYKINKGINRSIEFRGLKAQYIWYLGGAMLGLLLLFALMYFVGVPSLVCVGVTAVLGAGSVMQIYSMSSRYGEHGLMKTLAYRKVPKLIRCKSRMVFMAKAESGHEEGVSGAQN